MKEIEIYNNEKVDWNVLNDYIHNNLITSNKHPEYDIYILNYTPKTQFKQFWDDITLSCRGLVVDGDGNILAKPLKKFKNIEEYDESEIDLNQDFDVFKKMDGSLIILFYYSVMKSWVFASRGSFISEQAKEAEKMFNKKHLNKLETDFTYVFEILYPENRIVVDYGNTRDMVLLTKIDTKSGRELYYDDMYAKYSKFLTVVERFYAHDKNNKNPKIKSLYDLKKLNKENEEGFVIRFLNGMRVKIKFEEYVRLHRIITNVSNLTVWEHLKNNYDFNELIDRVPDEFYSWLKKTIHELKCQYNEIERNALLDFVRIYHINGIRERKEFATEACKCDYTSILFKLYDKKKYDEIIWKQIRPIFSKPFKDGYNLDETDF